MNLSSRKYKKTLIALGMVALCCKPSSGAGVVWVEISLSHMVTPDHKMVPGPNRSGLRMIVPSRESWKNAGRIVVCHRGMQGCKFEPRR